MVRFSTFRTSYRSKAATLRIALLAVLLLSGHYLRRLSPRRSTTLRASATAVWM
jgi:hypothetical protein